MYRSFIMKQIQTFGYDKYKESPNSFDDCLQGNIVFLVLPTNYDENNCSYDMLSIIETCEMLQQRLYTGIVVIKSTVEPNTTQLLSKKFKNLKLVHNPEFLTASTAFEDFHNQKHIVLGKSQNIHNEDLETLQTTNGYDEKMTIETLWKQKYK